MYCPNCGNKMPRKIDWKILAKYLPPEAKVKCRKCRMTLVLVDSTSFDQEGYCEVVFH